MNKFFNLIKVELTGTLGLNKLIHNKASKGKLIGFAILFLFVLVSILFSSFMYSYMMAQSFSQVGSLHLLISIMMAAGSIVSLVTTIAKASSVLFTYSDYDVVMSLPIKTSTIIASRIASLYFLNILFILLIMIPAFVAYLMFGGFSIAFCVAFFLTLFFIPLIPIIIATLIGMVVSIIASRFKVSNIFTIILSLIFIVGIMAISSVISLPSSQMSEGQFYDIAKLISDQIFRSYPLTQLYTQGVCLGDMLSLAGFILLNISFFAVFVSMINWKYKKLCATLSAKRTSRNYKLTNLKGEHAFTALYKKEIKRFFSSSIYVINSSFGTIMLLIASIACIVVDIKSIDGISELLPMLKPVLPMIVSALIASVCTSCCSISLEGKSFWILKSLPISNKDIYNSKILFNLTVSIPALIISNILFIISLSLDPVTSILLFVSPIIFTIFSSVFGLFVNIKIPNFNWKNETAVVKQSIASMIGLLAPLLIGVIFTVVALAFPGYATILLIDLSVAVIAVVLYSLVIKTKLNSIGE